MQPGTTNDSSDLQIVGHMWVTGLTKVMIKPALHTYSSSHSQLRHIEVDATMGRLESCLQAIMNAIWSQT